MLDKAESSTTKVTAIDWAFVGIGKIGEEIGTALSIDLLFVDVAAGDARELSQAIFTGYCDGLCDAGWHGDLNLARFGYLVTAALSYGLAFCDGVAHALQQPNGGVIGEAIVGKPINEVVEQYIETLPFLLDCGDEALTLMRSI